MKWLANLLRRPVGAISRFVNRYEGAQPSSPKRSWLPGFVRDARFDANSYTRWELVRKIRYFDKNTWIVPAIRDTWVKWTVGPNGMQVVPASSDDAWNERMAESYAEWCQNPTLDSTVNMAAVHKQISACHHTENEIFILKTRKKLPGQPARPAIQLVPGHRISSPGQSYTIIDNQDDIIDGVQMGRDVLNNVVCPIGYWVLDGVQATSWVFRSTDDMLHVFAPRLVGMVRDVTRYAPVINTLHDLDDLELMEMERAKQNSEVSNIIKNASGTISADDKRSRRWGALSATPVNDPKEDSLDQRVHLYRKILGSRTVALKTGEELEQFGSETPSAATQWYWRYKIGQICSACNVPVILVFPELIETMQGTAIRGIYDNAHVTFRESFHLYAYAAADMYRFFANWARYNDPRCYDAPADWDKCHVTPPRAVNVDIGKNSQAMLQELAMGTTNFDAIYGAQGSTARVGLTKKAKEIKLIKQIAQQISEDGDGIEVKPEEICGQLGVVQPPQITDDGTPTGGDDDDEPKKKPNDQTKKKQKAKA